MKNNSRRLKESSKSRFFWDLLGHRKNEEEKVPDIKFQEKLSSDAYLTEEESEEEFKRLWQVIKSIKTEKGRSTYTIYKIAASVAILLISSLLVWYIQWYQHTTRIVSPYGKITEVWLPDSSHVLLNANSELTYSTAWKYGRTREVTLKGEAFFSVRKQNIPEGSVKFIVHNSNWDIEVIGTEFNVLNRDSNKLVVLESGKIRLTSQKDTSIIMQPGQMIEQKEGKKLVSDHVNPKDYSAWRYYEMVFRDTPLREITSKIEEVHRVKVVLADDAIGELRLTGTYPTNNLKLLLKMVAGSANIQVRQKANKVIFY